MNVTEHEDFGLMMVCAERYACGRRTYMPSVVVGFIRPLLPELDDNALGVIYRDVSERADHELGDNCDVVLWRKFQGEVETEINRREGNEAD